MILEDGVIRIRQSWLGTAFMCAERGRQAIIADDKDVEGDAAAAGTAAHAAIEAILNGTVTLDLAEQYAQQWATKLVEEGGPRGPIVYKSFDAPSELIYHAGNCTRGWIQDVMPVLIERGELEGEQEVRFEFEAFMHRDQLIIFQGTVDHIPSFGQRIWDWKNKGSDMRQKELQKHDVQSIVYPAAAVNGCFGREFNFPMEFAWGNNIRLKTKARGQVVHVERRQEHYDWLCRRVRTFVDLYLDLGLDREWPTTSDGNFLCSKKWCPWYDGCRGKHITRDMDLYGM